MLAWQGHSRARRGGSGGSPLPPGSHLSPVLPSRAMHGECHHLPQDHTVTQEAVAGGDIRAPPSPHRSPGTLPHKRQVTSPCLVADMKPTGQVAQEHLGPQQWVGQFWGWGPTAQQQGCSWSQRLGGICLS